MPMTFNGQQLTDEMRKEVMRAVVSMTEKVRAEAVRLVLRTPKSGRVYGSGRTQHRASAPGEPWASNTGFTVGQIKSHYDENQLTGRVTIDADWGAYLELGTNKMDPRPVLRPALDNTSREAQQIFNEAVARAVSRLGGPS